jgi:anti-anti-sigma factor
MAHDIAVRVEQDAAVVTLRGEHETYTADKLARHISGLLAEGMSVVVDLREATFIDSTVIGVLLAARRRAQAEELRFVLLLGSHTGWPVRRLLEVTGLVTQFDVVG